MKNVFILFIIWNVITALAYGADKLRAVKGSRRIQESVLLGLAVIFGGVGAMFGMVVFNHKTSKPLFRFVVPVAVVVNLVVLWKIAVLF